MVGESEADDERRIRGGLERGECGLNKRPSKIPLMIAAQVDSTEEVWRTHLDAI